jgi:transposase-like protein
MKRDDVFWRLGMTPVESVQIVESWASCPLCHTVDKTVTLETLRAGASWKCARCGQSWDGERLERVNAYTRFEAARQLSETHQPR